MQTLLTALLDPQYAVQPVIDEAGQPRWLGHVGQGVVEVLAMGAEAAELFDALIAAGCLAKENEVTVWG